MTVAEMLDRISSSELTEWVALYGLRHNERKKEEKELENKPKRGRRGRR